MFVMPNSRRRIDSLALVLFLAVIVVLATDLRAQAQVTTTWKTGATTWEDNTSWSGGSVPGPNDTAVFPNAATGGPNFVFFLANHQVGQVQFPSDAQAYTFGAGGAGVTLQFNSPIGINNLSGLPQEFGSGNFVITSSQTWNVALAGASTILDTPVSGAGVSLTKTGAGDL